MKKILGMTILLLSGVALATGNGHNNDPEMQQDQHQGQGQEQGQHQGQQQGQSNAVTVETAAAGGAANNEGNELSVNSTYESGPADLVLVPNNNTESCLRVFGFAFGNTDGSGMFGVPWRSKQCDYKGFASDADAQGNIALGWFWRCHMKTAYKTFKSKGESVESAVTDCQTKMIDAVGMVRTISTLREQLTTVNEMRELDNESYKERMVLQRQLCEESNNRVHEACQTK